MFTDIVRHGRRRHYQPGPPIDVSDSFHDFDPQVHYAPQPSNNAKSGASFVPRPLAVSLFSGAGGFDEGVELAGFEIALALEIDRHAQATYRANFPGVPVVPGDIHDFLGARAARHRELYGLGGITLIIGGPPCAGFSTIGKRDPLDYRNELYREYVRVVADMRPSMFLMENLPNILLLSGEKFRDDILLGFRLAGYANAFHLRISAVDFGVPQHRERIFFVGTRDDLGLTSDLRPFADAFLSALKVASATTVREAIGDLPADVVPSGQSLPYPVAKSNPSDFLRRMRLDLAHGQFTLEAKRRRAVGSAEKLLHNHHTKEIGRRRAELISHLVPGEKGDSLPAHLWHGGRPGKWRRLHPDGPSHAILAHADRDLSEWVHPDFDRWITVRQAARLQGFHDGWVFRSSESQMLRQIGNAVPPPIRVRRLQTGAGNPEP